MFATFYLQDRGERTENYGKNRVEWDQKTFSYPISLLQIAALFCYVIYHVKYADSLTNLLIFDMKY